MLVDPDCPLEVRLCFRAEDDGVLRQWVTVTNRQTRPITLFEVAAASPLLASPSPHLTHFGGGDWAAEWTTTTEPLTPGTKLVDSRGGVRPHLQSSPFFLLSPDGAHGGDERDGPRRRAGLGGNTRFAFERTTAPTVRAWCGHNPMAAEYVLDPGATFTTPEQIWAWSSEGVGPLSRRLHRWVRDHAVRDGDAAAADRGEQLGGDLLRLRHRAAAGIIDRTADLGAELFLLDDGWFGTRTPAMTTRPAWVTGRSNEAKLPGGLVRSSRGRRARVRFGLWLEPEMVNPASALYADASRLGRRAAGRAPARNTASSYVLDTLQPAVADFVLEWSTARWPRTRASAT